MTRSELTRNILDRFPRLTSADIEASVQVILSAIGGSLAAGDRCEFRGFGSFQVNHRAARIGRNPKTGEKVSVPAKYAPHFKAAKVLATVLEPQHSNKEKAPAVR